MKDQRWFDRTFKAGSRKEPGVLRTDHEGVSIDWVVCNGKCRKGAIDPDCKLHGVWKLA